MSYVKTEWATGDVITAQKLNNMEDGIEAIDEYADIFTADVSESVENWLDDHPEATTTVEDNAITTPKLQDGAVTTPKLANGSVTDDKLASDGIKAEVTDLKTDFNNTTEDVIGHIKGVGELNPSLWEQGYWNTTTGSGGFDRGFWRSKGYIENDVLRVSSLDNNIGIAVLLYSASDVYYGWIKNGVISTASADSARTGFKTSVDLYQVRAKYPTYKIKLLFAHFDASYFYELAVLNKIEIFKGLDDEVEGISKQFYKLTSDHVINAYWLNSGVVEYSTFRVCNPKLISVSKGDKIYINTNILVGNYVLYDESYNVHTWDGWNAHDHKCYEIPIDGFVGFQFKKADNTQITPSDFDADVRLYIGTQRMFAPPLSVVTNAYKGEKIPSSIYGIKSEELLTMSYSGDLTSQDIDIFGGYMFVAFSGDDLIRVYSMADQSLVGSLEVNTNHGSGMQFSNEYYADSDAFPLLYVGGWTSNLINVVRVQLTNGTFSGTVVRTIKIPTTYGSYASPSIDGANNILYTYAHSNSSIPNSDNMIIASWDLDSLTDNGDNTYTPKLLGQCESPSVGTYQGHKYYGGRIYMTASNTGSPYEPKMYAIDCGSGEIVTTIDIKPILNSELEGLCYYINGSQIEWYLSGWFKIFKLDFN